MTAWKNCPVCVDAQLVSHGPDADCPRCAGVARREALPGGLVLVDGVAHSPSSLAWAHGVECLECPACGSRMTPYANPLPTGHADDVLDHCGACGTTFRCADTVARRVAAGTPLPVVEVPRAPLPRPPPGAEGLACPACREVPMRINAGELDEQACPACHGRLTQEENTLRVVERFAGMNMAEVKRLPWHSGRALKSCTGCRASMAPLKLRGHHVDLCLRCGNLFLGAGVLSALTGGLVREPT